MVHVYTIFVSIYMLMTRLLGIVPHILDFEPMAWRRRTHIADACEPKGLLSNAPPPPPPQPWWPSSFSCGSSVLASKYWKIYSFALCIAFAYGYPCALAKFLLKNPTNGKQGVNYFITWLYFGAKYIVTIIIYMVQLWNDKQLYGIQMESMRIYRKLCRFTMAAHLRQWPQRRTQQRQQFPIIGFPFDDNVGLHSNQHYYQRQNATNFAKTLAMIVGYCIVSYLKLVHIFHQPNTMNAFDLACYYYPNVYICLYVTQFSIGVRQQIHIFGKMNNVFQHFIIELNYFGVERDGAADASMRVKRSIGKLNGRNAGMRHAVNKLNALIIMHGALRRINSALECIVSLPIVFIIANAFMNIISEVRLIIYTYIESRE